MRATEMLIFGSFMLGVSCACRSWRAFWLTMLFGVFGIALWAQSAHGQSPTPEMQRAIVRIWTPDGSGGTGTLIGKNERAGLVLTANHVVKDGGGTCRVLFPGGQQHAGRIIAADAASDLAAIEIPVPAASPVVVANYAMQKGEPLASAGFGSPRENRLRINVGTLTHFTDHGDGRWSGIKLTGMARSGDSGGPIFNARGELAGVLWGSGDGVYGTNSQQVAVFLTQCRGGSCPPNWGGGGYEQPQYQQPPMAPVPPRVAAPVKPRVPAQPAGPRIVKGEPGPRGSAGERGPAGPQGPSGAEGMAGKDATIDYAALAEEVAKRLPPITFQYYDADTLIPGKEGTRAVRLGGTLKMQRSSFPVKQ